MCSLAHSWNNWNKSVIIQFHFTTPLFFTRLAKLLSFLLTSKATSSLIPVLSNLQHTSCVYIYNPVCNYLISLKLKGLFNMMMGFEPIPFWSLTLNLNPWATTFTSSGIHLCSHCQQQDISHPWPSHLWILSEVTKVFFSHSSLKPIRVYTTREAFETVMKVLR